MAEIVVETARRLVLLFAAFRALPFVAFQIHADLALVPPNTVCGKPHAVLVTLLRHHLLQVGAERRVWSGVLDVDFGRW